MVVVISKDVSSLDQTLLVTIMSTVPKAILYYDPRSAWSLAGVLCSQSLIEL